MSEPSPRQQVNLLAGGFHAPLAGMRHFVAWSSLAFALRAAADPCPQPLASGLAQHAMNTRAMMQLRGLPPPLDGAATVQQLTAYADGTRTTLLLYVAFPDALCAFRIAPGQPPASRRLAPMATIVDRLQAMHASLGLSSRALAQRRGFEESATPSAEPTAPFAQSAAALADSVIPAEWQATLSQTKYLVVLPTGVIGTIPFAVLPVGRARASLLDLTQTSMLSGLTPSRTPPATRRDLTWSFGGGEHSLVVGNPTAPERDAGWPWPDLPGAQGEALAAGRAFPAATTLVGTAATLASVRRSLADADYLYFATHGVADQDSPLDGSFLVLADGRLTARDLQSTELRASLAVLSACQTGLGAAHEGGVIGLSRAFQVAGVPSVVMSLWSVDDAATAFLMGHFTRELGVVPPDLALHRAMKKTRERFPQPDQWGAFVHFGWPVSNRLREVPAP